MNKQYFQYLIKTHKIPLLFFFAVYMIIALYDFAVGEALAAERAGHCIMAAGVMSVMLSFGIPIYLFSWMHQKKSCDVYGALPFSRREQLITSLSAAFLVCFGYFFIATAVPALIAKIGIVYLQTLGIMAVCSLVLLMFNTALYLIANNALDGIVMLGAYHLLPLILSGGIDIISGNLIAGGTGTGADLTQLSPVVITVRLMETALHPHSNVSETVRPWLYPVLLAVLAVLSVLLLKRHFVHRKLERAEQLSDDPLSYPLVIGIYTALCMTMIASDIVSSSVSTILYVFLIYAAYMISQFVYRRTIRPSWKMTLQFAAVTAAAFVFCLIGWQTHGFGISHKESDFAAEGTVYTYSVSYSNASESDDTYADYSLNYTYTADGTRTEAVQVLADYYRRCVDDFYQRSEDDSDVYVTFNIAGAGGRSAYSYYPHEKVQLTEEELKTLSQYGTVECSKWNVQGEEEISLEEFLEDMEK